jgi:hypothetical protein
MMGWKHPVSETLCSLEYLTIDKVQKPSNPNCHTPSSETFRICLALSCIVAMRHEDMLQLFVENRKTTINVSGLAM